MRALVNENNLLVIKLCSVISEYCKAYLQNRSKIAESMRGSLNDWAGEGISIHRTMYGAANRNPGMD